MSAPIFSRAGIAQFRFNYLGEDEPDRIPNAYGANYERLQELKRGMGSGRAVRGLTAPGRTASP